MQQSLAETARRVFLENALANHETTRATSWAAQQDLQRAIVSVDAALNTHGRHRQGHLHDAARRIENAQHLLSNNDVELDVTGVNLRVISENWYPSHSNIDINNLLHAASFLTSRGPVQLPPAAHDPVRHSTIWGTRWTYDVRESDDTIIVHRIQIPTAREIRIDRFLAENHGRGAARTWPTPTDED